VLCILHVGKNVRVKLEKKIIISCNFGTLLFYTLISSNTTLRYMFAQGFVSPKVRLSEGQFVLMSATHAFEVNSKWLSKVPCANMYLKVVLLEIKV
jgi:hypothetical protein